MIKHKLIALDHPNPTSVNCNDPLQFRSNVFWLEDQKIRFYKIEDRTGLQKYDSPYDWYKAYEKYKIDLNFPSDLENPSDEFLFLINRAIRLEYLDNINKYKTVNSKSVLSSQKLSAPIIKNRNFLDNMDFHHNEFKIAIRDLSKKLDITHHPDHLEQLRGISKLVKNNLSAAALKEPILEGLAFPYENGNNFGLNDESLEKPAKILRLLQVHNLRKLQTASNEIFVIIQNFTNVLDTKNKYKLPEPIEFKNENSKQLEKPLNIYTDISENSNSNYSFNSNKNRLDFSNKLYTKTVNSLSMQSLVESHSLENFKMDTAEVIKDTFNLNEHSPFKTIKRTNSNDAMANDYHQAKRAKIITENLNVQNNKNFDVTPRSLKIKILPVGFPNVLLNNDQLKAVQNSILKQILAIKQGEPKPKFQGSDIKPGWLVLNCSDAFSAGWLKTVTTDLRPWKGIELNAEDQNDDIFKPQIFDCYIPDSRDDSNDMILSLANAQNENLEILDWKILRRVEEGYFTKITLSVDDETIQARLIKMNYQINYKFDQIRMRPRYSGNSNVSSPFKMRISNDSKSISNWKPN